MGAVIVHVLLDGPDCRVGPRLVEFVAERAAVEAVDTEETGLFRERAEREILDVTGKIRLGGVVVLELVVAQAPVELDCVVTLGPAGEDGKGLEQLGGLVVFFVLD